MFGRGKTRCGKGPLLLAVAEVTSVHDLADRLGAEAFVAAYRGYLDSCEDLAKKTSGSVVGWLEGTVRFAWHDEGEAAAGIDLAGLCEQLLDVLRAVGRTARAAGLDVDLRVGMVRGDCVYEEKGRRIVEAYGDVPNRALRLVRRPLRPVQGREAVFVDESVRARFAEGDLEDVGDGAYRFSASGP